MCYAHLPLWSQPAVVLLGFLASTVTGALVDSNLRHTVASYASSAVNTDELGRRGILAKGSLRRSAKTREKQLEQRPTPYPYPYKYDDRYYLPKEELDHIHTIDCLQYKQHYPDRNCTAPDPLLYPPGSLDVGHYPSWNDKICHSNGEFFCDPRNMLTYEEGKAVTDNLALLKERTPVNCGLLRQKMDPDTERRWRYQSNSRPGEDDIRAFNLAVALADDWPVTERDVKSVQYFSRNLMTEWGMMPVYNGVDAGNGINAVQPVDQDPCPNTAVLFILPKQREAWITSPTCEFICESKGGPEVVAAVLDALDREGLEAGILAGIEQVANVLSLTIPRNLKQKSVPVRWRSQKWSPESEDAAWVWAVRILYALVIFFAIFFSVAFLYFQCAPCAQEKKGRRSGYRLYGDEGRRGFIEEGVTTMNRP